MTITYARAQAAVASDDNTDPAQASFGSGVTAGNLLVVTAIERSGGSAANFVISDNGSDTGWTKRVSETTEQANSSARRTHVVWERVATATDAAQSPFTVSVDDGTTSGKMCLADEFEAGATVTWAFEDVVAADTGTGSTSPLASGSTASTSGTQLLVGSAVWRLGTGGQTNIAFSGLGGVASSVGANNGRSVASAWAQDATTGTKSTSVSWDGTGHEGNVALLVFSATEDGGGATDVTPADAAHAHAADQPTLTQTHALTSNDATHAHGADQPALTQVHEIAVDSATHSHAADQPTVAQVHSITPAAASHAHSADQPTLGQVHAVAADDASHGHTADQVAISSAGDIAPDSAVHAHAADSPTLTQVHDLATNAATHAHSAAEPTLTSGVVITPADALHAHSADTPALTQVHVLAPDGALHGHVADQVALTQLHVLAVADALHGHAADAATLILGELSEPAPIKLSFREPARRIARAEAAHVVGRESRHVTYQEG